MNRSEFEQSLGAEPRDTARRYREEGDTDTGRDRAVAAAEAFEDRLELALRLPVDESTLLDTVLATPNTTRPSRPPAWLGIAASVVLLLGLGALAWWRLSPTESVADYVQEHYRHDGAGVLARAGQTTDPADVTTVLTRLGAGADPRLASDITFIKFCPTPDGRGAHMVMRTDDGPVTVIFMPKVTVAEPMLLRFDGVEAQVVALDAGSAAIIGAGGEAASVLSTRLREGLKPLPVDA